jgi:RNA-directed DNA polymerase
MITKARTFLDELNERMRQLEPALHPDKTRLIRPRNRRSVERGSPETSSPSRICARGHANGALRHRAQGDQEAYTKPSWAAMKLELRSDHARPDRENQRAGQTMLRGHLNYLAVSGSPWRFFNRMARSCRLRRRSETARLNWQKFIRLVARFFPPIRRLRPLPYHRFDAKTLGRSPVR